MRQEQDGFVDGSIPAPDANSVYLAHWMRCNAMVKGWLKSGMDKETRTSVRYASTAQEMWKDLSERFTKGSAPRAYELKRAIALLKQEKLSVSAYYTKLKALWDEIHSISPLPICSCGQCVCELQKNLVKMREREHLYEFLMGLDDTFNTVKTQILSMAPTFTLGYAYHLVAEDEQQRLVSGLNRTQQEASAFQTQTGDKRGFKKERPKCENCGKLGHAKEDCWVKAKCDECGKLGHTREDCWEIVGYPQEWRKNNKDKKEKSITWNGKKQGAKVVVAAVDDSPIPGLNNQQFEGLLKYIKDQKEGSCSNQGKAAVNMAGNIQSFKPWILDSGASEHITNNECLIYDLISSTQKHVSIPNGNSISVDGAGKSKILDSLVLDNVLLVPDFQCNLISVSKLTRKHNCMVIFTADNCIVQDLHSKALIGTGRQQDGLYFFDNLHDQNKKDCKTIALKVDATNCTMWHARLGHTSQFKIDHIGLNIVGKIDTNSCDSCMKAKQTRLPFPMSCIKTVACFDLIHCDIWGPLVLTISSL